MADKITVIVPVYNVEKYLRECVDSIINQTYKNLEIILVDDGSTDTSGLICDEYKARDSRITVLHKENGGLSDARNAGLDIATGDYITFVDSDDYIDLTLFETLLEGIKANGADIAVCNRRDFGDGESADSAKRNGAIKIKADFVSESKEFFCRTALKGSQSAWGRLYTRNVLKSIRFPVGRVVEDGYVLYDILLRANKVSYHRLVGYFYRRDLENSITGRKFQSRDTDTIVVNARTYMRLKRVYPSLTEACLFRAINKGFISVLRKTYRLGFRELLSLRKEKKKMRKAIKYMLADVMKSTELSSFKKLCVLGFYISPTLLLLINKTGIIIELWQTSRFL